MQDVCNRETVFPSKPGDIHLLHRCRINKCCETLNPQVEVIVVHCDVYKAENHEVSIICLGYSGREIVLSYVLGVYHVITVYSSTFILIFTLFIDHVASE